LNFTTVEALWERFRAHCHWPDDEVAAAYGFTVSGYGVGTAKVNVRRNGGAFGVANHTTMTVMSLLLATDDQAVGGLLYNGNAARRNMANSVYNTLNDAGSIS
jgi:hypothetical protein